MAENRHCTRNAIVSPAAILARHTDDQFRDLAPDGRSSRIEAALRAVELLRDQLAKPGQDCFWLGDRGQGFESSTSESFAEDG